MKAKLIGNIYYVFDKEAYELQVPEGAETIYVPEDQLHAYQELNSELTLLPFNYGVIHAIEQEWEPYIDAKDIPTHFTLEWADGCDQYVNEDYRYNSIQNNETTEILALDDMSDKFFDWNDVHKYDASYTGGTCEFRDLNWLLLNTAVEEEEVQTVTVSIVPKNYACENPEVGLQEKVVIVNLDEDTKRFETDQVYGLVDWAQGTYRYSATLDGNAIECTATGTGAVDDPVTISYNDGYYMLITVKDAEQGICEVNPTTQGTFIFTIVPENSIMYTGDECLDNPAGSAYEGDTVTLTAASGYTTTNVALTSDDVQLTVASATTWTFTMPATPVTINVEALHNSASLDNDTSAITINLVDATAFHSDALSGLFVESPNYTVTKDGSEVNDPTCNVTDDGDPDNPQVVSVEYGDGAGEIWYTITYDGDASNYLCTPNDQYPSGLTGTYVYTPVQL